MKLPYIGLSNIVLGNKLYPELLQTEVTVDRMVGELDEVWKQSGSFKESLNGLAETLRGPAPGPSRRVAETLLSA